MTRLVLAIMRLCALALSFCLATFATAAFLTLALFLGGDASWLDRDPASAVGSVAFLVISWFSIAQMSFAPALLIFAIFEFSRMTSLLMNVLAGGLIAISIVLLFPNFHEGALPYPDSEIWIATIASGFCGGLVHWILAGHRAGRWMGPRRGSDF